MDALIQLMTRNYLCGGENTCECQATCGARAGHPIRPHIASMLQQFGEAGGHNWDVQLQCVDVKPWEISLSDLTSNGIKC